MTGLLGPDGKPISSATLNKKAPAPALGAKYGEWGGPNAQIMNLPGGGAMMFDLDRLEVGDFRQMRDHYQISSSLAVLMFLLHQLEWRIVVDDAKQRDFYTEQIENIWTPMVRSLSQAFWAGYSPNVLEWDNEVATRRIALTKIKDLVPELSMVNWKRVEAPDNRKVSIYDGIRPLNAPVIPVENTFWYPVLMENGNMQGRKLLRSAFQPWFFSILLHLFANRYFERYGEPTPVGRAPFDEDIRFEGEEMHGNQAMEIILQQLRNRSAVVLPNDKTQWADNETRPDYDYQIEYLESQMRGADFERYMTRLDEEMSLAVFTPILLMRTADVGSYNLGTQHGIIYQWMLNAIGGDWKFYIDWYILRPMRDFNFGTNATLPRIAFRRMGSQNEELVRDVVRALVAKGAVNFDLAQLGEIAGLTLKQVKTLTKAPAPADPNAPPDPNAPAQPGDPSQPSQATNVWNVVESLSERIGQQVNNAYKRDELTLTEFSLGYQNQIRAALSNCGVLDADEKTISLFRSIDLLLNDMKIMKFQRTAEEFMRDFKVSLQVMVAQILPEV